jgi:DNA repair exonuclease SbcCD ATPase subunit
MTSDTIIRIMAAAGLPAIVVALITASRWSRRKPRVDEASVVQGMTLAWADAMRTDLSAAKKEIDTLKSEHEQERKTFEDKYKILEERLEKALSELEVARGQLIEAYRRLSDMRKHRQEEYEENLPGDAVD